MNPSTSTIAISGLSAMLLLLAAPPGGAGERAVSSGRNDVVYLSPATEPYEALPLGNGQLGVMVRNQGGMTYLFNHGSFFASADQNQLLISSGELTLRLPEAWMQGFVEERLVLHDGKLVTRFRSGDEAHVVTSWIAEGLDVLVVEIQSSATLPDLSTELWVWPRVGYAGDPLGPETKRVAADGHAALTTVGLSKMRATALVVESPVADQGHAKIDGDRAILMIPAAGRKSMTILAANPVTLGNDLTDAMALKESLAVLARARDAGVEELRKQHHTYWHDFWSKSSVVMHSDDGLANYVENLYHLFLYTMAGCSRGADAPKYNGGNYLLLNDWRSLGGQYWHRSTREMVWPLLASDHAELCSPFIDLYLRNVPAFERLARDFYEVEGACVEEALNRDGSGDKADNQFRSLYLTTGTEVAQQLHQYYLYTGNERFLTDKVYPFMKKTVAFHLSFVNRESDGRYHVYPSNARETYWWVKDSTTDLAALKAVLPILISTSERLGVGTKERAHWKDVLKNLAPFVTQDDALAPAQFLDRFPKSRFEKVAAVYRPIEERRTTLAKRNAFHAENVVCDPVYPWGLITLDSPADELERMRTTYRQRPFQAWTFDNAWDWSAPAAARLGMTDEVLKCLRDYLRNIQVFPNGAAATPTALPELWGQESPEHLGLDSAGVLATTVQEMQLQSHGGKIRVFPAWPQGWQSEFTLAAEGGFLISSRIQTDGRIPFIKVVSRRGGPCNVVNPWSEKVTVEVAGRLRSVGSSLVLSLPTEAGKLYELRPHHVVPDDPPIAVERNTGPKWPFHEGPDDTAEAYLARRDGYGFLGILRDGQNSLRNRVRKATGDDDYPEPPRLLLAADFNESLDATGSDGQIKAQSHGAKQTSGGNGAPASQDRSEAADIGYGGDRQARLSYDAPDHFEAKQGTISFWVKSNWHWDPKVTKDSRTLLAIPLSDQNSLNVVAYMHPSAAHIGFYLVEDGKQHSNYHRVAWKKDEWHHVAVTWNGWRTQLFVDGARVDRQYWGDSIFRLEHKPATIYVGCGPTGSAAEVMIDNLKIWNQPLREIVPGT